MTKSQYCEICHTVFKDSRSLATHKHKFHSTSSNPRERHSKTALETKDFSAVKRRGQLPRGKAHPAADFEESKKAASNINITATELKNLINQLKWRIEFQDNHLHDLFKDVLRLKLSVKNNSQLLANSNPQVLNVNEVPDLKWDNYITCEKIKELEDKVKKMEEQINIENDTTIEELFQDTLEIRDLFKNGALDAIKYKVKALKNATLMTSKLLTKQQYITPEESKLLQNISEDSLFDVRSLLKEHFVDLKLIFSRLPPESEFEEAIREREGTGSDGAESEYEGSEHEGSKHGGSDDGRSERGESQDDRSEDGGSEDNRPYGDGSESDDSEGGEHEVCEAVVRLGTLSGLASKGLKINIQYLYK